MMVHHHGPPNNARDAAACRNHGVDGRHGPAAAGQPYGEQIASAFDLVVHLGRLADGSRKIVQIAEVQGMEGDVIIMQDIFQFVQTTVENGKVQGFHAHGRTGPSSTCDLNLRACSSSRPRSCRPTQHV